MAETVGGVMANLALRHGIGKRVVVRGQRGNRVRVNRKERIQLSELLSKAHRDGKARRAKAGMDSVRPSKHGAFTGEFSEGPTEATMKLAKGPHRDFYRRLAFDDRIPTEVRMEAFARMAGERDAAEDG